MFVVPVDPISPINALCLSGSAPTAFIIEAVNKLIVSAICESPDCILSGFELSAASIKSTFEECLAEHDLKNNDNPNAWTLFPIFFTDHWDITIIAKDSAQKCRSVDRYHFKPKGLKEKVSNSAKIINY